MLLSTLIPSTIAFAVDPALRDSVDGLREDEAGQTVPDFEGAPVDKTSVVGGRQVVEGKWDDAVAIVFNEATVGCTGTLIGPKVVLTAAHCVEGASVRSVIVGTKDWTSGEGERLEVEEIIPPDDRNYDVALLLLEERSTIPPRPLAMECVLRDHLEDGAKVQMVGFGATRPTGNGFNSELNEAASTVLDRNCSQERVKGVPEPCNGRINPGGEIIAGGNGRNVCFGDSGGPLYLKTDDGDFVVGVASRVLGIPGEPVCGGIAIWVRPDAVIDWIYDNIGGRQLAVPVCNDAPDVFLGEYVTTVDRSLTRAAVIVDDGDSTEVQLEVVQEPSNGRVVIDGAQRVTYIPDPGFEGEDAFTVSATDAGVERFERTGAPVTVELDVPVTVLPKAGLGGCQTASGPASVGLLALLGLALGRRRRT
ncbi:MAG: trypsin-like serine protease [Myxococcales bacterium]|nr:trypsin-like serine protease [Myxococcales bacterium]